MVCFALTLALITLASSMAQPLSFAAAEVTKLGVYDYFTEESSPIIFNGALLMLESIPVQYANYDPTFSNCTAYFRIRDMHTLLTVVNITATCNQAFGSATVIPGINGASDTLIVLGTQWDRRSVPIPSSQQSILRWSGPCTGPSPSNCTVNMFSSSSPLLEDNSWVTHVGGIQVPFGIYNTDAMSVPASADSPYRWVIALETTSETARFLASSSIDPLDLSSWQILNSSYTVPRFPDVGSCPSLRHDGTHFYYLTGGSNIHILRSSNLKDWVESTRNVLNHGDAGDCIIAPSWFGPYVPVGTALQHLTTCGISGNFGDDSDVDLAQWDTPFGNAANGPVTLLQYGSGDQRTFGFSNLAIYNGTMTSFLQSFF